jgi:hypothetical protein
MRQTASPNSMTGILDFVQQAHNFIAAVVKGVASRYAAQQAARALLAGSLWQARFWQARFWQALGREHPRR